MWHCQILCDVVNKIWYNDLKDAETFYTKVTALEIMARLNAFSRGLHAINIPPARWQPPIHCHDRGFSKEGKTS